MPSTHSDYELESLIFNFQLRFVMVIITIIIIRMINMDNSNYFTPF